tara:strand:+ start:17885 stop:18223 length:339 start_codon:yes stop_codon:yes gene_type:complete
MPRYKYNRKINNNNEFYRFLREKRDVKNIVQYETTKMKNPTISERMSLVTDTHVWKYGDRYYKLADKYYNDINYWWVIAWYNGSPTEADVTPGDVLEIPVNLEEALEVLGAY